MIKPRPSYAQKLAVIKRQQNGTTWREALAAEGVDVTICTAQRWAQLEREQGAGGARDQRGGVKWKVTPSLSLSSAVNAQRRFSPLAERVSRYRAGEVKKYYR